MVVQIQQMKRNFVLPFLSICFLLTSCIGIKKSQLREMYASNRPHVDSKDLTGLELGPREESIANSVTGRADVSKAVEKANRDVASAIGSLLARFPNLATHGYLYSGQPTPSGYGAYAYVIFNADPQKIQPERCMAVCEAFTGSFPATPAQSSIEERRSEMITFWPLTGKYLGDKPACRDLITNYDLGFAAKIAAAVGKQGVAGPLLVAWTKPYGEWTKETLVLDMSHFASKDFARAFGIWRGQIAKNPPLWRYHWKRTVITEEIRNVIENTGPDIVTVVAAFFDKSKPSK